MMAMIIITLLVLYFYIINYLQKSSTGKTRINKITVVITTILKAAPLLAALIFTILFCFVLKGRLLERTAHAILVLALWLCATQFYVYVLRHLKRKPVLIGSVVGLVLTLGAAAFFTPLDRYSAVLYSSLQQYALLFSCVVFLLIYIVILCSGKTLLTTYRTEYVQINQINQYLMHFPSKDKESPVVLFVHGGPGMAESVFAHAFQDGLSDYFTFVYWDERGAGKTLTKNPGKYPSMEELLLDLDQVILYLKKTYHQDKIILLGHSFGSVLSSLYTLQHPENLMCYIGAGQVIDICKNEEIGYQKLKELILQADNNKDLAMLEKIGIYPEHNYEKPMIKKLQNVRMMQGKYKIGMNFLPIMKTLFDSPIFVFSDLKSLVKGMSDNIKLWEYMFSHSLEEESHHYEVPVYYILGDHDFQAPITIAKEYFETIETQKKECFVIQNAGHFMMLDQPEQFVEVMVQIAQKW